MKLPDQLLVRYYRAGEADSVTQVVSADRAVTVTLQLATGAPRTDRWTDLGGGLGFVPAESSE